MIEPIVRMQPPFAVIQQTVFLFKPLVKRCAGIRHQNIVGGKGKFMPLAYKESMELPDNEYPLILTTDRSLYHFHTGTMTRAVEGLNVLMPCELVEINPIDAENLQIKDGEEVKVISRRGEVSVKTKVTDTTPPGIVAMTFHFTESPTNVLTNCAIDPVAKIPETKVCAVQIKKKRK